MKSIGLGLIVNLNYSDPYLLRDKDAGAYSVKAALERSRIFENADPGWKSVMKAHYGAIARGEYAAASFGCATPLAVTLTFLLWSLWLASLGSVVIPRYHGLSPEAV